MTDHVYRAKTYWFLDRKLACRLRPNHLHCERGWTRDFAYAEIEEIRIVCYWTRGAVAAVHAVVRGSAGSVTITSCSDTFVGGAECQAASFMPFIEALVERVRAANPSAAFNIGSTGLFAFNMSVAAASAAMGLVTLGFAGSGGGPVGWMLLALAGGIALYGAKLGSRNEIGAQALLAKLRGHLGGGGRQPFGGMSDPGIRGR